MRKKSTTEAQVSTVKIAFSKKKMNSYGGFAFIAMVFAGADRFFHLIYLGNKDVLARMFGTK